MYWGLQCHAASSSDLTGVSVPVNAACVSWDGLAACPVFHSKASRVKLRTLKMLAKCFFLFVIYVIDFFDFIHLTSLSLSP